MSRSSDAFVRQFRAARRVSTPIVNVRTPDPESSLSLIKSALKEDQAPLVQWDTVRGLVHHNEPGRDEISRLLGEIARMDCHDVMYVPRVLVLRNLLMRHIREDAV